ncbi:MAG TPA: Crp/Fnr family transcriptional regulator [Candidatus Tumulicola sp.]
MKTSKGNLFLDNLSPNAMDAIRPSLVPIALEHGEIVDQPGKPFDRVVFPINSIVSVVLDMADGDTAEVGIVGREGMTGLSIVLGQSTAQHRTIVQLPDGAACMPVPDLRNALEKEPDLRSAMLRYAQATINASSYLSACNGLHMTNERCARWLLMGHDRVVGDVLPLTQEFLSQMLGVQRTAVNIAAGVLQEAGFISYTRGHITIRNRSGLESAACECYDGMDETWQNVMGYSTKKPA